VKPRGQDTVKLRFADAVEDERFVDEAEVAGTVVLRAVAVGVGQCR
jgi:hypothetical protein